MARLGLHQCDVMRVTRRDYDRGQASGWQFEAGWFRRASGIEWAWFSREVDESEENSTCK